VWIGRRRERMGSSRYLLPFGMWNGRRGRRRETMGFRWQLLPFGVKNKRRERMSGVTPPDRCNSLV
jgi:hypothetical protein